MYSATKYIIIPVLPSPPSIHSTELSSHKIETPHPVNYTFSFPPPQGPGNCSSTFCLYDLTTLDSLKWNHAVFIFRD